MYPFPPSTLEVAFQAWPRYQPAPLDMTQKEIEALTPPTEIDSAIKIFFLYHTLPDDDITKNKMVAWLMQAKRGGDIPERLDQVHYLNILLDNMTSLDLSHQGLSDQHLSLIAEHLIYSKKLLHLTLADNQFSCLSVCWINTILTTNTYLKTLDIRNNRFTLEDIHFLENTLYSAPQIMPALFTKNHEVSLPPQSSSLCPNTVHSTVHPYQPTSISTFSRSTPISDQPTHERAHDDDLMQQDEGTLPPPFFEPLPKHTRFPCFSYSSDEPLSTKICIYPYD